MNHIIPAEWKAGRPKKDGYYLVIMAYDRKREPIDFTVAGGWNTHRDRADRLFANYAIPDEDVLCWLDVEDPQEVTP